MNVKWVMRVAPPFLMYRRARCTRQPVIFCLRVMAHDHVIHSTISQSFVYLVVVVQGVYARWEHCNNRKTLEQLTTRLATENIARTETTASSTLDSYSGKPSLPSEHNICYHVRKTPKAPCRETRGTHDGSPTGHRLEFTINGTRRIRLDSYDVGEVVEWGNA